MLRILVLFSKKQFEGDHQYGKVVDDDQTNNITRQRYFGKRIFVQGVTYLEDERFKEAVQAYEQAIILVPA